MKLWVLCESLSVWNEHTLNKWEYIYTTEKLYKHHMLITMANVMVLVFSIFNDGCMK